jgi:methionyl-tRNA synthetase
MQTQNPLHLVASRNFELMEYVDLLNLLTAIDEHGSEADKRADSGECKRTEEAISTVHRHISDMWLAEDCRAGGECIVH